MEALAEKVEHKTCLVRFVSRGHADKVIKIYPAEHEKEEVWMDTAPGEERAKFLERMQTLHASRDLPLYRPVPIASDSKSAPIPDSQIPLNRLEGFVLKALPAESITPKQATSLNPAVDNLQFRLNGLEKTMAEMAAALKTVTEKLVSVNKLEVAQAEAEVKRGPGRPKKEV